MFPVYLPIPPDRDIDFAIKLNIGTKPIIVPLCHMVLTELEDLKE